MGKAQDAKIAEKMLQQKTVFWVPRDTWAEWSTFDLEDPFQFQEDLRASRVIDST